MSARGTAALCFVGAVVLAIFIAVTLRVDTDITNFMPAGDDPVLRAVSKRLLHSDLARTMVFTIGAEDLDTAIQASSWLEAELGKQPGVRNVRHGIDSTELEAAYELYFPRRYYFLSSEPEVEIPTLISDSGLETAARDLKRQLAGPRGAILARVAASDPLGVFARTLERLRGRGMGLDLVSGHFVTRDRTRAVLLATTHASPYDVANQGPLLTWLDRAERRMQTAFGSTVALSQSGVNRFAYRIEQDMRADVYRIAAVSLLGVAAVFLVFFRSLRLLFVASIPHGLGILVALAASVLLFGSITHLALGFAFALAGVSIDYAIHLTNHRSLAGPNETPEDTVSRLRPSLVLGAVTTVASFAGLAIASFPGFDQMGWVAGIAVTSALLVSLYALPKLLGVPRASGFANSVQALLDRHAARVGASRGLVAISVGAICAAGIWGGLGLVWQDDIAKLSRLDSGLLAQEAEQRSHLRRWDQGRFLVATGSSVESALQRNEALRSRLRQAVNDGTLEAFESLSDLLWSASLQQRNLAGLAADEALSSRLAVALERHGFRSESFRDLSVELAAMPAPLTLADLQETSLGELSRAMVLELEAELGTEGGSSETASVAILTFLSEVSSSEALAAVVQDQEGVFLFEQREFMSGIYGEYRRRVVGVVLSGSVLVLLILLLRYRRPAPALAAFLPSLLTALALLALARVASYELNLVHLLCLVLVMGIGVDYGIFTVDTALRREPAGPTQLSLLISCITTLFVFGTLAISSYPPLRAMGVTTAAGLLFSFLSAPAALVLLSSSKHD